jgi:hypothetical protein
VNGQITDGDEGIAHAVQELRDSGVKGGGGWWRVGMVADERWKIGDFGLRIWDLGFLGIRNVKSEKKFGICDEIFFVDAKPFRDAFHRGRGPGGSPSPRLRRIKAGPYRMTRSGF